MIYRKNNYLRIPNKTETIHHMMLKDKPSFVKISSKLDVSAKENNVSVVNNCLYSQIHQNYEVVLQQQFSSDFRCFASQDKDFTHNEELQTNGDNSIEQIQKQGNLSTLKQFKNNIQKEQQNQQSKNSIQKIKKINNGISCSDFIFCSQIPFQKAIQNKSISLGELSSKAGNFDILLFKNHTTMSKMQRFLTGSDFDHVAMILKIGQDRYILESSGRTGVCLSDFNKFINNLRGRLHSKQQKKYQLGYRKFKYQKYGKQKLDELNSKCEQFVRRVIGKKYKFSPIYLISDQHQKKEETYFCSQLLAQLLRICKIIRLKKPSFKILPRNFGSKRVKNEDKDMQIAQDQQKQENQDVLQGVYGAVKMVILRQNSSIIFNKQNFL